ncbi:TldD/PmbA family protein [Oceanirhabdus sp. W0125-5]|uniref:TldD/PmbA family protein n=1 Tax=Oceanirhabdus sp. W0125-5 TaxID=2999116 RepID=UPI0022F2E79A|nr:TldD/PmbA family protein [Oceanirhabdus sp. W0125-5]WBW97522.1 TldD/PmbA family protein [Oceanirhabdus sp. W0125-5]
MLFNDFKDRLFEIAEKQGFESYELYYVTSEDFNVQMFKGEIDKYSVNNTIGISFRGLYKGQMGYAYTEIMDEEAIDLLIRKAKENASVIEKEEHEEIFEGAEHYVNVGGYCEKIAKLHAGDKIELARQLEKATYAADKRVESTQACGIATHETNKRITNSKGMDRSFTSNIIYGFVGAVVKDENNTNSGNEIGITRNFDDLNIKKIAQDAVREGLSLFNAESIKSGKYKVMFTNKASAELLKTFRGIFSGESAVKGLTLLKDKVGEIVASENITIYDNPLLENGICNIPFDDEGYMTSNKKVVDKGRLNTLLHNRATAKKFNIESTGNASRASYSSPLAVSASNMYFQAGSKNYDEMIKILQNGVVISKMQGMHSGANSTTGDFSLSAKGFLIENGVLIKPVEQITISGNYFELLKNIEEVGCDLRFSYIGSTSSYGSPSIIVKELSIAGK